MARVRLKDSDSFVQSSGYGFFRISEDGETKCIRLLYNSIDDIPADIVHRVVVDGKTRWVNCLRNNADDPEHICPLCAAKNPRQRRVFLRVYEITKFNKKGEDIEGDVKYWDRGNSIISDLESLSRRYAPLVSHIFEVERKGKRGDMSTQYKFFDTNHDDKTLEDYPAEEDILGTIILDKTAEEMNEFIETGSFPKSSDTFEEDERPARSARKREEAFEEKESQVPERRSRREVVEDEEDDEAPFTPTRRRNRA